MKEAWLEHRNATASATSSGSPMRPSRWNGPPTRLVFFLSPWVTSSIRRHQVQPGETELTRILSAAKSMDSLRVSCSIDALVQDYSLHPVCNTMAMMLHNLTQASPTN